MVVVSIAVPGAAKSIQLSAAYFVPDDLSVETLVAARKRGVKIEVILPGRKTDTKITEKASRSRWGDLLRAGVESRHVGKIVQLDIFVADTCLVLQPGHDRVV